MAAADGLEGELLLPRDGVATNQSPSNRGLQGLV
jgi:hypothetical protein